LAKAEAIHRSVADTGAAILAAEGIEATKADAQAAALAIRHSPKNQEAKGVEIADEARPAR